MATDFLHAGYLLRDSLNKNPLREEVMTYVTGELMLCWFVCKASEKWFASSEHKCHIYLEKTVKYNQMF